MTLTILICVHSTNEFHDMLLNKSILSLVNQTYKKFKTIIVLDQCWGKTKEMINSLNYDLDLTVLIKDKKEGLSYAKNFGLQYVNTEWVGFLDADDLYLPTKLEQQVDYIQNNEAFPVKREINRFIGDRIDENNNPVGNDYKLVN